MKIIFIYPIVKSKTYEFKLFILTYKRCQNNILILNNDLNRSKQKLLNLNLAIVKFITILHKNLQHSVILIIITIGEEMNTIQ